MKQILSARQGRQPELHYVMHINMPHSSRAKSSQIGSLIKPQNFPVSLSDASVLHLPCIASCSFNPCTTPASTC